MSFSLQFSNFYCRKEKVKFYVSIGVKTIIFPIDVHTQQMVLKIVSTDETSQKSVRVSARDNGILASVKRGRKYDREGHDFNLLSLKIGTIFHK